MCELADTGNILICHVHNVLHEHLHIKKAYNGCPITFGNSWSETHSNECFSRVLWWFTTVDKTWIHHTKHQRQNSSQGNGYKCSKWSENCSITWKRGDVYFWGDSQGAGLTDYLEKMQNISEEYYVGFLEQLNEAIMVKCFHLAKRKLLFHQNNAPNYTLSKDNWEASWIALWITVTCTVLARFSYQ